MIKRLEIPFVKSRGWECGQACVAMIIRYFRPSFVYDFDEFNQIIHHKEGNYTFPLQNVLLLNHYGVTAKCYSAEDAPTTKEDPQIFKRWFGNEYKTQIKKVDVETYNWAVGECRKKNLFEKRKTKFEKIISLFKKNKLVMFPIDWNTLNNKDGEYNGHFVILSGIKDENTLLLHDPDTGPFIEYRKEKVEKAYNYPIITDDLIVAQCPIF